jgi:hypothetical protein
MIPRPPSSLVCMRFPSLINRYPSCLYPLLSKDSAFDIYQSVWWHVEVSVECTYEKWEEQRKLSWQASTFHGRIKTCWSQRVSLLFWTREVWSPGVMVWWCQETTPNMWKASDPLCIQKYLQDVKFCQLSCLLFHMSCRHVCWHVLCIYWYVI